MPGMTGGERRLNFAPRHFAVTRLNEAQPGGVGGRFSPVFHVELSQDVLDVGLHRVFRDRQGIGKLGVGHASGHQPKNLHLPGR